MVDRAKTYSVITMQNLILILTVCVHLRGSKNLGDDGHWAATGQQIVIITLVYVRPRMTEFGVVKQVEKSILWEQPHHIPMVRDLPQRP